MAGRPLRRRGRVRGALTPGRRSGARDEARQRATALLDDARRSTTRAAPRARRRRRARALPGRARHVGRDRSSASGSASRRRLGPRGAARRSRRATRRRAAVRGRRLAVAGPARADRPLPRPPDRSRSATPAAACAGSARGVMPGGEGAEVPQLPRAELFKKSQHPVRPAPGAAGDREEATGRSWSRATPT